MKKRKIIVALGLLCVASLVMMALALGREGTPPAFTPPPFEERAQNGEPAVPGGLGYQIVDLGTYRVGISGTVTAAGEKAQVWFSNPEGNPVWLRLRILDSRGNVLGQTGILRPGEYVDQVLLEETPKPGMPLELKVMAYEPETYHSAGAVSFETGLTVE